MNKQLDMYEVRVLPYNYAGVHNGIERTYQITVKVNGEEVNYMQGIPAEVPPYMTEVEVLNKMTQSILSEVREKYESN